MSRAHDEVEVVIAEDGYKSIVVHTRHHPTHDQFCEAARNQWRTEVCGCMQRWLVHPERCECCPGVR